MSWSPGQVVHFDEDVGGIENGQVVAHRDERRPRFQFLLFVHRQESRHFPAIAAVDVQVDEGHAHGTGRVLDILFRSRSRSRTAPVLNPSQ